MNTPTTKPPEDVLIRIRNRDKTCVYCGKEFDQEHTLNRRGDWDTVEHLNHKQDWDSVGDYMREGKPVQEIVSICCMACNSSRGSKSLAEWFASDYCLKKGISLDTVAPVVQEYFSKFEDTSAS